MLSVRVSSLTLLGLELAALHSKAVDYVKTGQPAEMPKRLRARKWPHFMEKNFKPKTSIYHSEKILGKLYDKVESVAFMPQWQEPFDKRILRAYKLDDALLKLVRQTKSKYDTAMRRIMAQQEIETEFEVWSTFVLSKPRVGTDYKVQEEMARISDALKDQFRKVCIEHAGGNNFAILAPFVAGMYKVTKEELDIALAECRSTKLVGGREVPRRKMVPKSMPLISFPWLFEKELARIATGVDAESESLGLRPLGLKDATKLRKRAGVGVTGDLDDYIQQENGVMVYRGEELDLFRTNGNSDDLSGDSDFEDARRVRDEHSLVMGKSGEVVLDTEFHPQAVPHHLHGGTGVEDVVPRTILDGFVDAEHYDRIVREYQTSSDTYQTFPKSSIGTTSLAEMTLLSEDASAGPEEDIGSESDQRLEEEVIDLDLGDSSLEKLRNLVAP
jgi:RNA-dependent RNA polymerase